MIQKIKIWIQKNRIEAVLLTLVLLFTVCLRLYKISGYMTFLGDEGRDMIVVRRLLVNFDPILVGPGTSIGNMYLGPLYYYLIAPFLLLFNFSPVGPSVMVALLGILTVYIVWFVARKWFGKLAAFVSALLYATAPVVITYSRSSWNPNIMPFFALLCIYSIWRVYQNLEFKWLMVLGVSFAFVLNSHYLGLLLIPTLGLFWLLTLLKVKKVKGKSLELKDLVRYSVFGLGIFCLLMSPLVVFDARHDWRNFEAIKTFFTIRQETVSIKPWSALPKLGDIWNKINTRLITATKDSLSGFFGLFMSIFATAYLFANLRKLKDLVTKKNDDRFAAFILLIAWITTSLVGFGVYKQEIYDHYYGFIFAAVFILLGFLFQEFYKLNKFIGSLLVVVFVPILFVNNLKNSPLKYPPNNQLQRSVDVAKRMKELSDGREFNFAVIAERNYEGAYQYFLEKDNAPFVIIDAQRSDETIKDQLFVVCELPVEKCDPTHNAKTEIANFGWSKVEYQEEFEGVTIFKLVHY